MLSLTGGGTVLDQLATGAETHVEIHQSADFSSTAKVRRNFQQSTSTDMALFAVHDVDGNQELDFEEFLALQPARILKNFSVDEIRMWFDTADLDGSGSLCIVRLTPLCHVSVSCSAC